MALQEEIRTEPCSFAIRIGLRVRSVRKRQGKTLLEVAAACGTTPQTIQRIETARMTVSLSWIQRIAEALDVAPDSFFETESATLHHVRNAAAILQHRLDDFLKDTSAA